MQARLLAVVVLPSDGVALVKSMNFGGCPAVESKREVRSERNASANWDLGCERTLMLDCAVDRLAASSAVDRRDRGTMASEGSSVMFSISAMLRRPVSRLSIRKATMIPASKL